MKHQVQLTNGQTLQIEEGENRIHIAAMQGGYTDAYICEINVNGVLVMPNSGSAGENLVRGLSFPDSPPSTVEGRHFNQPRRNNEKQAK